MEYNVYCDESCHLQHDDSRVMTIGCVYLPIEKKSEVCKRIIDIKEKYNVKKNSEIKWTKVSNLKLDMYEEIIDYFFDDDDLHFRCIVADKTHLNHAKYGQTHDDWYYKIYFDMLKVIFEPKNTYNIYIDIKDTNSHERANELNTYLCKQQYDFSRTMIKKVQPIRSEEVQIMQITDILIGAINARNRFDFPLGIQNKAKIELIRHIMKRSGYTLSINTLYREHKLNIFKWEADYYEQH